jgi:hypothetical protein
VRSETAIGTPGVTREFLRLNVTKP